MAQYRGGKPNPFDGCDDEGAFQTNNTRGKNPFDDDEAEDNFEEVGQSTDFLRIKQEKELLEKRMIESTYRSVGLINESQQVATETGESLQVQREKLERTNKTLEKMQDDLNETDRNITGLKSIWGTMSNWFKKPVKKSVPVDDSEGQKDDGLSSKESTALKETNDGIHRNLNQLRMINVQEPHSVRQSGAHNYNEPTSVDNIVDKNLDQMLAGLSMLKTHGLALGDEIDSQNKLLDDISSKVEKTDTKIGFQENKIRKILK